MSLREVMLQNSKLRRIQQRAVLLAIFTGAMLSTTPAHAQTTYTWNDSTTAWPTTTAWTPAGPADWSNAARLTDALASFGNQATIANQPNLTGAPSIDVRGISIDDTGAAWNLSGSIPLNLGAGGITLTGADTKTTSLSASTNLSFPQTWTVGQGMTLAVTNSFSGSSDLTKAGPGTLSLSNNSNDYSGAITISGGTLSVSSMADGGTNSALGAGGAAASNLKFAGPGATLEYTGAGNSSNRRFTVPVDGATIVANSSGALSLTSTDGLTYSGSGARTLTLGGTNTGANTLAAAIADGPGGTTSIVKSGAGAWILSGNATYTGGTTVLGGVLGLSGDRSAATGTIYLAGGKIEVANGTKIGGNIVFHNETAFQGSQGGTDAAQTNSPHIFGDSPEEFEFEGNATFEEGSELGLGIDGPQPQTGYDRMDVDGNISLGGSTLSLFAGDFTPNLGDIYYIINNKGANPINGQFANAPEGSILTSGGHSFQVTYFADVDSNSLTGGNDVALIAVPEPATNLLALSAALLMMARFTRRKRRR